LYLDENGNWMENESDGTVIRIGTGQMQKPEFQFTKENGYLTEVSFLIELEDQQHWLSSYNTQMFLASLAFAGAQNEVGLFSKVPSRIADQIDKHTFMSYHFSEAGIVFVCDIEYSGYRDPVSNVLIPEEDAEKNYFRLNFTLNKEQ